MMRPPSSPRRYVSFRPIHCGRVCFHTRWYRRLFPVVYWFKMFHYYEKTVIELAAAQWWECLNLMLSLGVIPCKYHDKLHLFRNQKDCPTRLWKPHDRIFIRLPTTPERVGQTDRPTELLWLLQRSAFKHQGQGRFRLSKWEDHSYSKSKVM